MQRSLRKPESALVSTSRYILGFTRALSSMSTSSPHILQGVLAINKPPAISSAQVIRDAQRHFNPSSIFKPLLDHEKSKRDLENHNQKQRRSRNKRVNQVKMGHGGTLDPMATGVLILGIGSGTKHLASFLECTKTYETVVLFGAATDTYDSEGKIVGRKSYGHVTKQLVEEALAKFTGDIMQKPPIYSALRIDGKRLYDYAREGLPLPREIETRPVRVDKLEIADWLDGSSHGWHWPTKEGDDRDRIAMEKLVHMEADDSTSAQPTELTSLSDTTNTSKRKRVESAEPTEIPQSKSLKVGEASTDVHDEGAEHLDPSSKEQTTRNPCPAPAVRLRMTVTSGFYVRSLCHDLGAAVGSLGLMSSLVRTDQGQFELGRNVLEYEDLGKGEEVWGPQVTSMLQTWQNEHKDGSQGGQDGKEVARRHQERRSQGRERWQNRIRRNTSSEED